MKDLYRIVVAAATTILVSSRRTFAFTSKHPTQHSSATAAASVRSLSSSKWQKVAAWKTTPSTQLHVSSSSSSTRRGHSHSSRKQQQQQSNENNNFSFLMDDFKTSNGELLNPYRVLKVPREADRQQIKQAYREMCRRYHPDMVRHRDILPGSCDNLEQVGEQFERVKISFEILSDTKRRKRYDRNEALSDPAGAVGRAVGKAAWDGVASVGKGIFGLGAKAVEHVVMTTTQREEEDVIPMTTTSRDERK